MRQRIFIIKANGERHLYSEKKLKQSLRRAGASKDVVREAARVIRKKLRYGMTTKEIYRLAFQYLKKIERPAATRYNLKRAIFDLGPHGYPFERFVGEIFRAQGFQVSLQKIVSGYCIQHEVDVQAVKENEVHYIECKFHNSQGFATDIKTALYVKARMEDIIEKSKGQKSKFKIAKPWLVTNTRFTYDAEKYAECAGLNLLSWNYPGGNSLIEIIEKENLQPITTLTTLTNYEKKILIQNGIVLCNNILKDPNLLRLLHLTRIKYNAILKEIEGLHLPSDYR